MLKVNYRFFELRDIPYLVELGIKLTEELTNQTVEIHKDHRNSSAKFFQSGFVHQNYLCAIAEIDGTIVSVGGICVYNTPPNPSVIEGKVGFLTNFYTLPDFRKHGISTKVLDMLISQSREFNIVRLHMGTTDKGLGLYLKAGFKEPSYKQLTLRL